jgi:hypothetical protein
VEYFSKMFQTTHLLTVPACSHHVVEVLDKVLRDAGLSVVPSFDLQAAKATISPCTCPHHGSALCDCQMIVLLIYEGREKPVTLIAHGQDRKTHIGVINGPDRGDSSRVEAIIQKEFLTDSPNPTNQSLWADAT